MVGMNALQLHHVIERDARPVQRPVSVAPPVLGREQLGEASAVPCPSARASSARAP